MTLILDLPLQENDATPNYDGLDAGDNDGVLSVGNTQDYDTTGPGGTLTKAVDGAVLISGAGQISLETPITITPTGQGCLEWFSKRNNTTGSDDTVLSNGEGSIGLAFKAGGHALAFIGGFNDAQISTGLTTTAWCHHAINCNTDGSMTYFGNGVSVGNFSQSRDGDLVIGLIAENPEFAAGFDGAFCGFKIYDTTRTQPQIAADFGVIAAAPVSKSAQHIYRKLLSGH